MGLKIQSGLIENKRVTGKQQGHVARFLKIEALFHQNRSERAGKSWTGMSPLASIWRGR
jgi:hypothetical protein